MNVRKPEVAARATECEFLVVESQKGENGGMEIMNVDFVLCGLEPEFVRRPMDIAAFYASTRHPDGKTVVIVITAIDFARVAAGRG